LPWWPGHHARTQFVPPCFEARFNELLTIEEYKAERMARVVDRVATPRQRQNDERPCFAEG
jgi:hypothetical protein